MAPEQHIDSLIGIDNLAAVSGLPTHQQAFNHMMVALGLADRGIPLGCTREQFLELAGMVHDRVRGALAGGRMAG